jgi:conjugative relaxase-like TrwC/TraI family protein
MLGVAKLTDHSCDYYLGDLGDELASLAPSRAGAGARWVGTGSLALGIDGEVGGPALSSLLEGRHPRTGRPLLTARRKVLGLDLTFSAPKSASIAFGLAGARAARQVLEGHGAAVDAAVSHLERRAWTARRVTDDGRCSVATDGVVGAAFTHCLSRNGDPHLHTHVVVTNLAHGIDGRWSALDTRGPFVHARAAGALYEAHLRAELTERLGVSWSWSEGRGWDMAGVDPTVRAAFSTRAAEIREHAASLGYGSSAARRVAWAATRQEKIPARGGAEIRSAWSRRLRETPGWRLERGPGGASGHLDEHRFAAAIASLGGSGVCRRDVVAAWADGLASGGRGPAVEAAVEHWAPTGEHALGVAEPRTAPSAYVPGPHLLRALGPRPSAPDAQPLWRGAAAAIERYRDRWGAEGPGLDCPRRDLVALPRQRLADHLELGRTVADARVRMGGHSSVRREPEGLALGM